LIGVGLGWSSPEGVLTQRAQDVIAFGTEGWQRRARCETFLKL
jgi:hypothetical protein